MGLRTVRICMALISSGAHLYSLSLSQNFEQKYCPEEADPDLSCSTSHRFGEK